MLGSGPPPELPVVLAGAVLPFWLFYCKASLIFSSMAKCLIVDCIPLLARKCKTD